jgi:hypothetical protein
VVFSRPRIVPLTCQQWFCWRVSRVLRLLFTRPPLPQLSGLCIGRLPCMIHLATPAPKSCGYRTWGQQGDASVSSELDIWQAPHACRSTSLAHGRRTPPVYRRPLSLASSSLSLWKRACVALFCAGITLLTPQHFRRIKSLEPSPPHLTSNAHVWKTPAETATADLPDPRSTAGRFAPISAPPHKPLSPPCPIHHIHRRKSTKHRKCRSIALGDYRCCRRRDKICRRTRAAPSSCSPST